ncbi:MAG: PH domain-containing protein [Clostridium sp.]|nr:PH domain-containing protein [Clostridium sp.]
MIDFKNGAFLKLKKISNDEILNQVAPLLISGEELISSYKTIRDFVVFTSKRVIAVNVQGFTGAKKDFTSLPYSKVQAYSVETAGTFDLDSELEMYFSALGKVKFEFKGNSDIVKIGQIISEYVL